MKNKNILLALLTMLLWGSLFPMVKLGFRVYHIVSTADILLFAGIRFVICGGIILVFATLKNTQQNGCINRSILPILLSGVFSIVLHYSFTYVGLELTNSSKTALLKQVGALLYVCFSFVFIKEDKPTIKKILAAIAGFAGIYVLNYTDEGFSFSFGDVLILCASFCTVISNVISKKVFETTSPILSTGISQLFGGLILLLVGTSLGGKVHIAFDTPWWIMVYICVASIVSYCIWYKIVEHGDLSNLFIIKFAESIFACLFGAMILNENIWTIQYLIAVLLIAGGIILSNINFKGKILTKK